MSNVSIYGKNWIDLVFEGKNQEYGAYQLRKENPKTTLLSLFYGTLLVGGITGFFIFGNLTSNPPVFTLPDNTDDVIRVTNWITPKKEEKKDALPAAKKEEKKETEKIDKKDLVNPTIVKHDENPDDVKTNNELKQNSSNNPSEGSNGIIGGTGNPDSNGTSTLTNTESGNNGESKNGPFITSELDRLPAFPGGIERFYQYVGKNFEKPELESGTVISVMVAFVIEKDGSMTDIKVIRNPGHGLGNEAIRVLKSLKTKWSPGVKNGQKVRTEYVLPIKVKID